MTDQYLADLDAQLANISARLAEVKGQTVQSPTTLSQSSRALSPDPGRGTVAATMSFEGTTALESDTTRFGAVVQATPLPAERGRTRARSAMPVGNKPGGKKRISVSRAPARKPSQDFGVDAMGPTAEDKEREEAKLRRIEEFAKQYKEPEKHIGTWAESLKDKHEENVRTWNRWATRRASLDGVGKAKSASSLYEDGRDTSGEASRRNSVGDPRRAATCEADDQATAFRKEGSSGAHRRRSLGAERSRPRSRDVAPAHGRKNSQTLRRESGSSSTARQPPAAALVPVSSAPANSSPVSPGRAISQLLSTITRSISETLIGEGSAPTRSPSKPGRPGGRGGVDRSRGSGREDSGSVSGSRSGSHSDSGSGSGAGTLSRRDSTAQALTRTGSFSGSCGGIGHARSSSSSSSNNNSSSTTTTGSAHVRSSSGSSSSGAQTLSRSDGHVIIPHSGLSQDRDSNGTGSGDSNTPAAATTVSKTGTASGRVVSPKPAAPTDKTRRASTNSSPKAATKRLAITRQTSDGGTKTVVISRRKSTNL